jgi:serine/threonine-protein kinase
MSTDSEDPLLDAALSVTDRRAVAWERLRRAMQGEQRTIAGLEALATIAAAMADDTVADGPVAFQWGPLQARKVLGVGSYGEVWSAWDPVLHREVALKLQKHSSQEERHWLSEARRLARVRHPNVVTVHGADEHDGRIGLWMDLVRGSTLEDVLARSGPFGAREAALAGIELCSALAAVHGMGLVHGDVKARNVMREGAPGHSADAGRVVLMDFGSTHDRSLQWAEGGSRVSPLYAAPEVLHGERPSPSSDLYALGVLLYRLVTAAYPVEAASTEELRDHLDRGETNSLRSRRPDLPPAFVQAVERAMEKDASRRFRDAAEMERALSAVLGSSDASQTARRAAPWTRVALVLAGIATGALGLWVAQRSPHWFAPRFVVAPTGPPITTTLRASIPGSQFRGRFGQPVTAAGDVNGDSLPDLLVGAAGENQRRGAVYFYLGRHGDQPVEAVRFVGEGSTEAFGGSIAAGGDLNGDGFGDFAIADPLYGGGNGQDAGRVSVWFGGPQVHQQADLVLNGKRPGQIFGFDLCLAGDVNGDGAADLLVGAPGDASAGQPTGRAYLFYGGAAMDTLPDLEMTRVASDAQFGVGAKLGDVNGDGFADMVLSANYENTDAPLAGRVYVFLGGRSPDAQPDLTLAGPSERAYFGYPLCVADFNGDRCADIAARYVGDRESDVVRSYVRIYCGGLRLDPQQDLELAGNSRSFADALEATGDVNGDGLTDLFVSCPAEDSQNGGIVYLYFGGRSMDGTADVQVLGDGGSRALFGWSAASCGDLNGDGFGDLAIGSPGTQDYAGRLDLFTCSRYAFIRPRSDEVWHPGTATVISWSGAEPADLALSRDDGHTYEPLGTGVGGAAENSVPFEVPEALDHTLFLRLTPHRTGVAGQTLLGPLRIAH